MARTVIFVAYGFAMVYSWCIVWARKEGNEMEEKREHKFYDKHTIPGMLVLVYVGLIVAQLPAGITAIDQNSNALNLAGGIGVAVLACLMMLFFKRKFRPEFDGFSSKVDGKTAAYIFLPFIIFWVISIPVEIFVAKSMHVPTIAMVGLALAAGFAEEIAFRGYGESYLMRQWSGEKSVINTLILISVLFGLTHGANMAAGANPAGTVVQLFGSTFIGIFLGAIFLATGNLWIPIIIHVIHDILAFATQPVFNGGIVTEGMNAMDIVDLLLCAGLACCGLYLVRKSKRAEIRAMWDEKWSKTGE